MLFRRPLNGYSIGTFADIEIYGNLHKQHQQRLQEEISKSQEWLKIYCQQANMKKISAEFTCEYGEVGKQICQKAKSWDANLIIIGRRGHRGIAEILLGSVSNYVLHHAPCSVLVVQEKLPATSKVNLTTTTV